MFRNRWGALLFVAMTLAGVTTLVGTDRKNGALAQATDQIADQKVAVDRFSSDSPAPVDEHTEEVEFTPDEDLIDDASGEDPTPPSENDPSIVPDAQVAIVSRDDPRGPQQPSENQPPAQTPQ